MSSAYQRRVGEYKTWPHTRALLAGWRVLCVNQAERDRADEIEKAFDAEDRERVAAGGFLDKVREMCSDVKALLKGKS